MAFFVFWKGVNRKFATLGQAVEFASVVFEKTGIVVGITEGGKA